METSSATAKQACTVSLPQAHANMKFRHYFWGI